MFTGRASFAGKCVKCICFVTPFMTLVGQTYGNIFVLNGVLCTDNGVSLWN